MILVALFLRNGRTLPFSLLIDEFPTRKVMHTYEVRLHKDKRGVDLISDALPFGRLWYDTPDDAVGYAMHSSHSHDGLIRVYDNAGNVIETHEHKGEFREV
jgi:hypothetical protein